MRFKKLQNGQKHTAISLALPMGWAQIAVESHPVGDALDQAARAATLGIPLIAMD